MMEIGKELARLRKEKGLSQQELADLLRVSRQAVSRWENGSAIPAMENMIFLARLYDLPLDKLAAWGKEAPGQEQRAGIGKESAAPEAPPRRGWKGIVRWVLLLLCAFALGIVVCALAVWWGQRETIEIAEIPGEEVRIFPEEFQIE